MPIASVRRRGTAVLHRLGVAGRPELPGRFGLAGVVLLAALFCDLIIITVSSTVHWDSIPESWLGIVIQVPGLLAITAGALRARDRPVPAAWMISAVLVLMTALIQIVGAIRILPSGVLPNVSFAETVAGVELVYFCVRSARAGYAAAAVTSVVVATSITVFGMHARWIDAGAERLLIGLTGLGLLVPSVVLGVRARKSVRQESDDRNSTRLQQHWPLVGLLTVTLFLEVFSTWTAGSSALTSGPWGVAPILLSVGAVVITGFALHRPLLSGGMLAVIVIVSGLLFALQDLAPRYAVIGGITFTQVVSGAVISIVGIRYLPPRAASTSIGLLGLAVTGAVLLNHAQAGAAALRTLFIVGLLLLGIAVATGLYLRSRDSERQRIVDSAVYRAQTTERMALARELHDVVAHHVSGIVVQAQATKTRVGEHSELGSSLDGIEQAGTEALTAMRRIVSSMRHNARGRDDVGDQATTDLAADLRDLVESGIHPVPVHLELDLAVAVPQEVARSALRLVQEPLTNIGKHAVDATFATVLAETTDDALHLRIADNATQQSEHPVVEQGYGLVGMRERVELLHGTLLAGPAPEGGWIVDVWLPLGEEGLS